MKNIKNKIIIILLALGALVSFISTTTIKNSLNQNLEEITAQSSNSNEEEISTKKYSSNERTLSQEEVDAFYEPWINSFELIERDGKAVGFRTTEAVDLQSILFDDELDVGSIHLWTGYNGETVDSFNLYYELDNTIEYYFTETRTLDIKISTKVGSQEPYYTTLAEGVEATCLGDEIYAPWINSYTDISDGEDIIGFEATEEIDFDSLPEISSIVIYMQNISTDERHSYSINFESGYDNKLKGYFATTGIFDISIETHFEVIPDVQLSIFQTTLRTNVDGFSAADSYYKPWINSFEEIKKDGKTIGFRTTAPIDYVGSKPLRTMDVRIYDADYEGDEPWWTDSLEVNWDGYHNTLTYYFKRDLTCDVEIVTNWDFESNGYHTSYVETYTTLATDVTGYGTTTDEVIETFYQPWIDSFTEIKRGSNTVGFRTTEKVSFDSSLPFYPSTVELKIVEGETTVDIVGIEFGTGDFDEGRLEYYFTRAGTFDVKITTIFDYEGSFYTFNTLIAENIVVAGPTILDSIDAFYQPWIDSFSIIEMDGKNVGFETTESLVMAENPNITNIEINVKKDGTEVDSFTVKLSEFDGTISRYFIYDGTFDIEIESRVYLGIDGTRTVKTSLATGVEGNKAGDVFYKPWINSVVEIKDGENVIGFKTAEPVDLTKVDGEVIVTIKNDVGSYGTTVDTFHPNMDGSNNTLEYYFSESGTMKVTIQTSLDSQIIYTSLGYEFEATTIFEPWVSSFEVITEGEEDDGEVIGFRTTEEVDLTKYQGIDSISIEARRDGYVLDTHELKTDGSDNTFTFTFSDEGVYDVVVNTEYNGHNYYTELISDIYAIPMDIYDVNEMLVEEFVEPLISEKEIMEASGAYEGYPYGIRWIDVDLGKTSVKNSQELIIEFKNIDTDEVVETEVISSAQNIDYYEFTPEDSGTYSIIATTTFGESETHSIVIEEGVRLTTLDDQALPPTYTDDASFPFMTLVIIVAGIGLIIFLIISRKKKKSLKDKE